jgi:hypothetical protein
MPTLLCEGASCNAGISAEERFTTLFGKREPVFVTAADADRIKHARMRVTSALKYTRHEPSGEEPKYVCLECGHIRRWG